jgi:hypothetical protein
VPATVASGAPLGDILHPLHPPVRPMEALNSSMHNQKPPKTRIFHLQLPRLLRSMQMYVKLRKIARAGVRVAAKRYLTLSTPSYSCYSSINTGTINHLCFLKSRTGEGGHLPKRHWKVQAPWA